MARFFRQVLVGFFRVMAVAAIFGGAAGVCWQSYRFAGELGAAGAGGLVLVITVVLAYRNVPTLKLGVVKFLNLRTGRVLGEGPHLVIPLFETVVFLKAEVQTIEVEESFPCLDNLWVIMEGTLQWRVDKELAATAYLDHQDAIPQGLADAIRSEIGGVAGANRALDFKGAWEAVSDLINCSLRMGAPPHLARNVPPEQRLKFYADAHGAIRNRLQRETRLAEERSEIENRYGIEVIAFSVGRVGYTPATSAAMEKEGQAILLARGSRVTASAKRVIVHDGKMDGLSASQAENAAEVVMDRAQRTVHSVEGLERFKPLSPPESRNYGGFLCHRTN